MTTIEVQNPADHTVVGAIETMTPKAVATAVEQLRREQVEWERMGPKSRAVWMGRWREWLLDNESRLADVLQSESAKPRAEAGIEPALASDMLNYFSGHAAEFLKDSKRKPHGPLGLSKRLTNVYRPYPVVGVISPWNFPLAMPMMDVAPALAAGAAVALKPSEVTPLSAVELGRGWDEIGAPKVFRVLTGDGATGAALVDSADYIQFTGSTATGRAIALQAAARLIPYSLELGGKDAAIVLADANLDRAVDGVAWGALFNAGQVCVSVERVYVEAPIYDEFVQRLARHVGTLSVGQDDSGYKFDVGPLATPDQRAIVSKQVDDAVEKGASALVGGHEGAQGNFYEPTVLVDVDHTMSCMRDETFGPTIPVVKVENVEEAVRLANDSLYGLSATIWSGDRRRAEQIARQLDVGAVNVNDAFSNLFNFTLPHSGWKTSGIGARFGGADGVRKYTRQQAITSPRGPVMKRELLWFPYTPSRGKIVGRLLRAITGRGRARISS